MNNIYASFDKWPERLKEEYWDYGLTNLSSDELIECVIMTVEFFENLKKEAKKEFINRKLKKWQGLLY